MRDQEAGRPTIEFPWQQTRRLTDHELEQVAAGTANRVPLFIGCIALPLLCIIAGTILVVFQNDSDGVYAILSGIAIGWVLNNKRYRDRVAAYEELLDHWRQRGTSDKSRG